MLTTLKLFGCVTLALFAIVGCQTIRNSGTDTLNSPQTGALRLATYNVHYIILSEETGPWSVGDWDRRKEPLDTAFKTIQADIIGFQEMQSFRRGVGRAGNLTLDWLLENNPDYAAAAAGDPAVFPTSQPILYRRDKFEILDQGWFFFSDTPDVIYSRTFNGSFPAFTAWAQFRDKTNGAVFRVINLHTDFSSRTNRQQSTALVADRIAPWIADDETLFVIGDFNARSGAATLDNIANVGLDFAPVKGSTYHFNRGFNLFGAIDQISHRGAATRVSDPIVLRHKFDGEWPTDHYPVIVDYQLNE